VSGASRAEGSPPFRVEIRVQGRIDEHWSDWFEGLTITHSTAGPGAAETVLTGLVVDQAALYGLLANLGALGLSLLSVTRVEGVPPKKEGRDARDDPGNQEPGQEIR
jgi:hypothetical protein